MAGIEVVLPARGVRRWMALTVERLEQAGHDVSIRHLEVAPPWSAAVDLLINLDSRFLTRRRCPLISISDNIRERRGIAAVLRLDLTGASPPDGTRTLTLAFASKSSVAGIVDALVAGPLPLVTIALDGDAVGYAAPMIDNRVSIASGIDDVLARAVTLAVGTVEQLMRGERPPGGGAHTPRPSPPASFASYLSAVAIRVTREIVRRRRYRFAHWRSGYRISGGVWSELHDDGSRFFADPFPFTHDGRRFVFVEDFEHTAGKGVISFCEINADGIAGSPRKCIEEKTHLSYPQVFACDGHVWMIPENSAAREVVLYRAEIFPDRWIRHAVLIRDAEISDATLLVRDGHYWLFGTVRDGHGSTSDTMAAYHAPALTGPWIAHPANPIIIDRRRARPAGAFIEHEGRTYLPVQDGTDGYGGGISLSELIEMTPTRIHFGDPVSFDPAARGSHRIHTYNRAGELEVIDWIVDMPAHLKAPLATAPGGSDRTQGVASFRVSTGA